jgi:predicted HicB family RNase H-like nuclease
MKEKEVVSEKRGRPRKYSEGEVRYRVLWAPENLLMELRVAARIRGVSMNDEVVSRLNQSINFKQKSSIISSEDGERYLSLARLFDEFIQAHLDVLRKKYEKESRENGVEREFIPGKLKKFSSSFPVELKKQMEISARFNKRSINQEIVQRLLGTLNYFTEQQLPENEEINKLRSLAMLFDEFIVSKICDSENIEDKKSEHGSDKIS